MTIECVYAFFFFSSPLNNLRMGNEISTETYYPIAMKRITDFLQQAKKNNRINPLLDYYRDYEQEMKLALADKDLLDTGVNRSIILCEIERLSSLWNRQMLIPLFGYAIPDEKATVNTNLKPLLRLGVGLDIGHTCFGTLDVWWMQWMQWIQCMNLKINKSIGYKTPSKQMASSTYKKSIQRSVFC